MREKLKAIFNALGACAAIYAIFELMRIIGYYWHVVALPYPLTYPEFFFLALGMAWVVAAVIDNLYLPADLLGLKFRLSLCPSRNILKYIEKVKKEVKK